MIDFVFTLDYEIFGNGTGRLRDLVYDPAASLIDIFCKHNARFVAFVEAAELQKIEAHGTDEAIGKVQEQVKELYQKGFEIGLHLHPQWCNAEFSNGVWALDYDEYNLCTLPRPRIAQIVHGALDYLRNILDEARFSPLSFRAGNWLFQPTRYAADVLAENGVRLDSSVFKGGLQHRHALDYRNALRNGAFWKFGEDVNRPDPAGRLVEVPIYSRMVPIWRMTTSKRLGMAGNAGLGGPDIAQKLARVSDFLRFRYPLKLDFCRMTFKELTSMLDSVIREDKRNPGEYRPIVAIGHTKDFIDPSTVEELLSYLNANAVSVSTFADVYPRLFESSN